MRNSLRSPLYCKKFVLEERFCKSPFDLLGRFIAERRYRKVEVEQFFARSTIPNRTVFRNGLVKVFADSAFEIFHKVVHNYLQ